MLYRLALALGIGLLVGVERHWREREAEAGRRTAGLRTFGLIGLLGGLAAALAQAARGGAEGVPAALLLGLPFLGLSAALIVFKLREAIAEQSFSVTGVVAAQAVFALGALAVLGDAGTAAAAAVATTALLASREVLHAFVRRLSWPELRSALLLLTMTLVALPLLPDRRIAALWGLNPARVWLLAVILAAVSFLGYVAVRLLGAAAGRLLAGAAAGLVSSTAATVTNARLARGGEPAGPLVAGALAAGAVAYARTAALALLASPAMARPLLPALAAGALVQAAAALLAGWRREERAAAETGRGGLGNPFEFGAVLRLAALLAGVGLLSEYAAARFGGVGAAAVAALSGLADVDAVTLSMAALTAAEALPASLAALAVAVAVATNTVAKIAYALALGGAGFGGRFALGTLAGLAAGAAALWLRPAGG
nr:DUF4010 domain-containing protein [Caldovatus aquaticus]